MAKEFDPFDVDTIKKYAWHLKVMGAYVQAPVPRIIGLSPYEVLISNDASALYPTSMIYSNIGFDTIRHRFYDGGIIKPFLNLLIQTFEMKKNNPGVIEQAYNGFKNALDQALKDYFTRRTVQNKKEVRLFTTEFYPYLFRKLISYDGDLQDIFKPINDQTYYLLKSYLYPLLETITWLSPQNRGYNQTAVEYVFFYEDFIKKPQNIYVFKNINSTKTTFEILEFNDGIKLFEKFIINPYGVLFDRHQDNLSFDTKLLKASLDKRRVIKNQMLVLEALNAQWSKIENILIEYFEQGEEYLNEEIANKILDIIQDTESREKRIKSLTTIRFNFKEKKMNLKDFVSLRISQLNINQLGIKVVLNSLYGIYGLVTWQFASPLIGNSITNAGKIYGTKLFQAVTVDYLTTKAENDNRRIADKNK